MTDKPAEVLKELRQMRGILGRIHTHLLTRAVAAALPEPNPTQTDLFGIPHRNDELTDDETFIDPPVEGYTTSIRGLENTVKAQATRIEELKGSVRRRDTVIKQANEELKVARCQPNLAWPMKQKQMERMENVCRLATAARRHLIAGRVAIAHQLLSPLASGAHDSYPEKENWNEEVFGNSTEARTGWEQGTDSIRRSIAEIAEPNEWSVADGGIEALRRFAEDWFRR